MKKKKLTLAVRFHERAIQEGITKNGVVVCSTAPLPMSEWKDNGKPKMAYRSFTDRLNELIGSIKEDTSNHKANLDDYDRGYDEGYLAGLNYAKELYYKED